MLISAPAGRPRATLAKALTSWGMSRYACQDPVRPSIVVRRPSLHADRDGLNHDGLNHDGDVISGELDSA
jgi:hypothetical protein